MAKRQKEIEWYEDANGCHICTSHHLDKYGYPKIQSNNVYMGVHRFIYMKNNGEIPKGLVVRHKCDNRLCINIDHLEIGTHQDNMDDKVARNRVSRMNGYKNPRTILSENDVIEIIKSKDKVSDLAKKYGVSATNIYSIKSGTRWTHIDRSEIIEQTN